MAERVLVVDDEKSIRRVVEYALQEGGFEVLSASRGDDALEVIEREPVDLVVLDLMLPGIDGIEVCRRIRATRNVPIIMLSARDDEVDKVLGLDIEVDPAARTVTRDGREVPLTFSEFEILLKLMKSPRRVFTREELMDHLWNGSFYGDLRSVDVHVRHLRQKVERDPANPVLIRTVRGVGYALGREDGTPE